VKTRSKQCLGGDSGDCGLLAGVLGPARLITVVICMSRKLSLWLAVACLGPPLLAGSANMADEDVQMAAYGFIKCGFNQTKNAFLACIASASLSLIASGCSIASLWVLPSPRPKLRTLETVTISVPFLAVVLFVVLSLWG